LLNPASTSSQQRSRGTCSPTVPPGRAAPYYPERKRIISNNKQEIIFVEY
jgi:hypothetical protein